MGKCKDLSEFERTKFCWLTDWVRGSLKLQLLSGVPSLQGRGQQSLTEHVGSIGLSDPTLICDILFQKR